MRTNPLTAAAVVIGGGIALQAVSASAQTATDVQGPTARTLPAGVPAPVPRAVLPMTPPTARLPVEGTLPSLSGATTWLNSPPLTPEGLRGKVVLVDVWTYTCINWLRTLPYVRAWAAKYKDHGLVVIGVHSPEFEVEKDLENVRRAVKFSNEYWPALYLVDAKGHIRYHQFGEGEYERTEKFIQQLLIEAGAIGVSREYAKVEARGPEVAADWSSLKSGENYIGYARTENFASPGGAARDKARVYSNPSRLRLNQWALSGNWTVGPQAAVLNRPNGRATYLFHARDLHLVMGPVARGKSSRFRILIDGQPPGPAHGTDVDAEGNGTVSDQRLYQLVRQPKGVEDREFQIEFLEADVQVLAFTFS